MKHGKTIILGIFVLVSLVFSKIPLDPVLGLDFSFTLLNGFGPAAGAVVGPVFGFAVIFLMKVVSVIIGISAWESLLMFFSILPMALSAAYFGSKDRKIIAVPLGCIALFLLHPIGQQVWFYSLFWLIPVFPYISDRFQLVSRSLGATFTDHAVGSVFWLYAVGIPAELWIASIPLVPFERMAFACGIAVSYALMMRFLKAVDSALQARWNVSFFKSLDAVPAEYKLK